MLKTLYLDLDSKISNLKLMMQNLRNQQVEDEMVEQKPERLVREEEGLFSFKSKYL